MSLNLTLVMPNVRAARPMRLISPESGLLALICLVDLATTLFWVSYRDATEGNPLMSFFLLHGGVPGFIVGKSLFVVPPLAVAEWARRRKPRFVQNALRIAIFAYLASYGLGIAQINNGHSPIALQVEEQLIARHNSRG